jgi:hypothetical protein
MSTQNTAAYLNDHLAGSTAALGLVEHLGDRPEEENPGFYRALHGEIQEDRQILRGLLQKLNCEESDMKKAMGWMAEKAGRLKWEAAGLDKNDLGLFEALELLALGIQGKKILWSALNEVAADYPQWAGTNFRGLEARAREQRERVEQKRKETARRALRGEAAAHGMGQ